MSKSLKILLIGLICTFFIFSTNCFAVNIEMNLDSNIETLSNNIANNVTSNVSDSPSNTVSSNVEASNAVSNNGASSSTQQNGADSTSQSFTSESTTTSSNKNVSVSDTLQALPESELGLTNILNILLITVGVVLIFLSVAIFIRLKK